MCVTRISLGLMINADVLSTSSRRLIFGGPVIALGLIGKRLFAVKSELMKHTWRPSTKYVLKSYKSQFVLNRAAVYRRADATNSSPTYVQR